MAVDLRIPALNHSTTLLGNSGSDERRHTTTVVDDYSERLKAAMAEAKPTPVKIPELARALGISYQAVRKVLQGGRLTAENNIAAARYLRVNSEWLATGKGERAPSGQADQLQISDDELAFLRNYRLILDEGEKERIAREVAQQAAKAQTMRQLILAEHGLLPHQQASDADRAAVDPARAMQYGKRPAARKRGT